MASRTVTSDQTGPHPDLEKVVRKHLDSRFLKPFAEHTRAAFAELEAKLASVSAPLILDSCCGTGDSTRRLAADYPDHFIIGVDKSAHRLGKERDAPLPGNAMLLRADLNDFYRLWTAAGLRAERHFIFYPNPWPRSDQLKRRWHGAPVFPDLITAGQQIEVRSNWRTYLEEFAAALGLAGHVADLEAVLVEAPVSPFEAKYASSGQDLWRLCSTLNF